MKALILNSGIGRRMGEAATNHPKCMTPLGDGDTIVSRQLRMLRLSGIREIVMTVGPFPDMLRQHASKYVPDIRYVHNPRYRETNYIYSMYLARSFLKDDILLLHGDLVTEPSVMEDLIRAEDSSVAVEDGIPLPQKDFKARISDGWITQIGVDVFGADCIASQPAYKLRQPDMQAWMEAIEVFCARQQTGVYAEEALNTVLDRLRLRPLQLRGRLCHEIDDSADLFDVTERLSRMGGRT